MPTATPDAAYRRDWWRSSLESTYGSFEENPEFWASISPNNYVGELSGSLQLHHGTADDSVPVEFSTSLQSQVLAAGRSAELYLYNGDDHILSNNFDVAMRRTIEFFDAHVKSPRSGG
jgi:dipeptidyl aminopeptidase/acylaminoacyl peptidase